MADQPKIYVYWKNGDVVTAVKDGDKWVVTDSEGDVYIIHDSVFVKLYIEQK